MKKIVNFFANLNLLAIIRYAATVLILIMFSIGADKGLTSFAFWGMVLAVSTLVVVSHIEGYRKGLMQGLNDGFQAGVEQQMNMPEFGEKLAEAINKAMSDKKEEEIVLESMDINDLLDKVSAKGFASLTEKEKELLIKLSK
jgi:hypothetical protein